jgi:hypothetical protein
MFMRANNFIDLPKPTPQLALSGLVKLDHSPIRESLPDSIDWASGADSKLRGIFTSTAPIKNLPIVLDNVSTAEGHLSNLPSETSTPVD